jgi:hypothetical protein
LGNFDDKYWNLAQAGVWVEYRSQDLVNEFEYASRIGYMALGFYPTMHEHKKVASLSELHRDLVNGRITAWGHSRESSTKIEQISVIEWTDLRLSPPHATKEHPLAGTIEPWTDIRLESTALKKHWRSVHETTGRTKFDWDEIQKLHKQAKERNPEFTQNALIEEIQAMYEERFNKEPPGRATIQKNIKSWA